MGNKITGKLEDFGKNLQQARKQAGLTQKQLAEKTGLSRRMIVYYESQGGEPDAFIVVQIARALKVSTDILLSLKNNEAPTPKKLKLWHSLKKAEELPLKDQNMVKEMIEALIAKNEKE